MRKLAYMALLALACDDPDVAAKAADVLEHGIVGAYAECVETSSFPVFGSVIKTFRFQVSSGDLDVNYFAEFPPVAVDSSVDSIDVSGECSGFNLEAFD